MAVVVVPGRPHARARPVWPRAGRGWVARPSRGPALAARAGGGGRKTDERGEGEQENKRTSGRCCASLLARFSSPRGPLPRKARAPRAQSAPPPAARARGRVRARLAPFAPCPPKSLSGGRQWRRRRPRTGWRVLTSRGVHTRACCSPGINEGLKSCAQRPLAATTATRGGREKRESGENRPGGRREEGGRRKSCGGRQAS